MMDGDRGLHQEAAPRRAVHAKQLARLDELREPLSLGVHCTPGQLDAH